MSDTSASQLRFWVYVERYDDGHAKDAEVLAQLGTETQERAIRFVTQILETPAVWPMEWFDENIADFLPDQPMKATTYAQRRRNNRYYDVWLIVVSD